MQYFEADKLTGTKSAVKTSSQWESVTCEEGSRRGEGGGIRNLWEADLHLSLLASTNAPPSSLRKPPEASSKNQIAHLVYMFCWHVPDSFFCPLGSSFILKCKLRRFHVLVRLFYPFLPVRVIVLASEAARLLSDNSSWPWCNQLLISHPDGQLALCVCLGRWMISFKTTVKQWRDS